MDNSQQQKAESSESALAPSQQQKPKPVAAKKRQLLSCSVLASSGALLAATILLGGYQLCRSQHHAEAEILVLGKIHCNRATSSNQLYAALKASPRSSWPPVTTINQRQYACISTYKVDVTDLRNP